MWQPSGRRNSIEIIADILRLLRLGTTGKTEITSTTKMSHEQTSNYLNWLVELKLLEEADKDIGVPSYRITQKGLNLLSGIENVREMLPRNGKIDILHHSKILEINIGQILVTRGVAELTREKKQFDTFVQKSLGRHRQGDWGEISDEDKHLNDEGLAKGLQLFSSYESGDFPEIWIITEANRSYTTVMFPDELTSMVPMEQYQQAADVKPLDDLAK